MKKIKKINIEDEKKIVEIINEKIYTEESENPKKINYKKKLEENIEFIKECYGLYNLNYQKREKEKELVDSLKTLYTNRTKTSSQILNKINNHFPNICIYCGYGESNTMDHYYPKEYYSEFAIYSLNLFPICGQCNSLKGTKFNNVNGDRLFINFYEDEISKDYLRVLLKYSEEDDVPVIIYTIDKGAPEILKSHVEKLNLLNRYNKIVIEKIGSIQRKHKNINLPIETLKEILYLEYEELQKKWGYNNWEALLYKELATNKNFLNSIDIKYKVCRETCSEYNKCFFENKLIEKCSDFEEVYLEESYY